MNVMFRYFTLRNQLQSLSKWPYILRVLVMTNFSLLIRMHEHSHTSSTVTVGGSRIVVRYWHFWLNTALWTNY
jgi:hypothetical protein